MLQLTSKGLFTLTESERESDVNSRWVLREYNLLFTSSGGKTSKKNLAFASSIHPK